MTRKTVSERNEQDIKAIQQLYNKSKKTNGAKHIAGKLKAKGHLINHKRISRLMREMNIRYVIQVVRPSTIH